MNKRQLACAVLGPVEAVTGLDTDHAATAIMHRPTGAAPAFVAAVCARWRSSRKIFVRWKHAPFFAFRFVQYDFNKQMDGLAGIHPPHAPLNRGSRGELTA